MSFLYKNAEERMKDVDCFLEIFKTVMTPLEYEKFYISFRTHPSFDEILDTKNKITHILCVITNMIHDLIQERNDDKIKCAFSDAIVYICQM